ncbi:DUF1194 domain-containing protein [Pseudoroseicyclus tamaricis]|uniref:DUF1194 domain-containing protein n=1 Tax=Pseudoroseicyclus tamaricis TaxID=2705421 RepID=A0A6B2JYK7_9RHOB|nr:DUF1194 domain-containing protein [Pseudoroseicyclus tamaricis]NDV01384.1 DUF1194 domain-containing protein [Pseudoroseicyclus tamaricis]
MRRLLAVAVALLLAAGPAAAQAPCRQALAIGLDVSGSVNAREYRLQLDGLAAALASPEVLARLAEPGPPVRLLVFEWSGPDAQRLLLPWTELAGEAAVLDAAARLRATPRLGAAPTTALGRAMEYGLAALGAQDACWTRTLDLSGDGTNNAGPRPQDIAAPEGVTVNGLVIGGIAIASDQELADIKQLTSYFRAYVLRGPGAFVEAALGWDDFETAMRRKLLRELKAMVIGRL